MNIQVFTANKRC